MNTKWASGIVLVGGIVLAAQARAVDDLTFSMVPIGGSIVNGHQTIAVEVFATANRAIRIENGVHDLPCVVSAASGGSGTLTWLSATTDPDADDIRASSAGVPFLFGNNGLSPANSTACQIFAIPFGQPPVNVPAGAVRYLGTHSYDVSDCAAGEFPINFECTDQPGGACDNKPESTNTTRFYEDEPPGAAQGPLVSLQLLGTTLMVPIAPCCVGGVFGPAANRYCCAAVQGGCADYRLLGDGCAPAVYGDAYPAETFGDGLIDVDDILCVRDNFVYGPEACPSGDIWPCEGPDGLVDVDDFIGVLGAFIGQPPCPDPCE